MIDWKNIRAGLWKRADKLIEKGESSVAVAKAIGVSHVAVLKYLKRSGKHEEWKEKKRTILYSSRDELIAQGLSIEEIAEEEEVTSLAINSYIKKSGKQSFWEEKREKTLEGQVRRIAEEEYPQLTQTSDNIERIVLECVRQYQTINCSELRTKLKEEKCLDFGRKAVMKILRKHQISRTQNQFRTIPLILLAQPVYLDLEPKGDYSMEEREEVLKYVQDEQPITIYQVTQRTNLGRETIINILKDENLVTFIPHKKKRRPEFDQFIAQGLTLEEIGQKNNVTREGVRKYITATGQYDDWKEQSERRKAEKSEQKAKQENELHQARQDLTNVLISKAYQKVDEGGWKYRRKALDYYYGGLKRTNRKNKVGKMVQIPLDSLISLFETYEMAERLDVKLSLKELAEKSGIKYFSYVGRFLQVAGLEPMFGARERSSPLSPNKVQAIERAYAYKFTSIDVAYFLGLEQNPWVVAQHFGDIKRSGVQKINRKQWLFLAKPESFGKGLQKGDHLFYRTASPIYELDDMAKEERINFPDEEVAKLLEIRPDCVEYGRKHRRWIEYDIKRLLKTLYPEKKVEKPYL